MLPTEQPFKTFTGLDGKPLTNGSVYFGVPGQDPITHPVTVYWDAAGALPVAQPARTVNGYIVNDSGSAANVFYNGSYSMSVIDAKGVQVFYAQTSDNFSVNTVVNNFLTDVGSSNGADKVGYIATGAGAQKRSLLDRGRDFVSAFDFMTATQISNVRAGVPTDITAALQAAFNAFPTFSCEIILPPGNYRLTGPVTTAGKGTRVRGASRYGTYLTAPDGAIFDMLRIAHQQCEVSNIIFRPSTATQVPIRAYAGRAHIHDCYLLAASNNSGIGILLTDLDPVTNAFVPGAYAHTIDNNTIGDAGFAFANGITETTTQGLQICRFHRNNILSNRPIKINKGGANSHFANLLQSSSGAAGAQVGVGITLGPNVVGEKISHNYIELFQAQIEAQSADNTYQLFHAVANHNDNCTASVSDAGAKNYVIEDPVGKVENRFGWSQRYTATQWGVNTPSGVNGYGMDTNGNCFMGAASGANHIINKAGTAQGGVILTVQGAGGTVLYVQHATAGTLNGAAAAITMGMNSGNGRSINCAGTLNTGGADYAEYMRKAEGVGTIAKGQIIGINANDQVTDRWADAVAFKIKSTDPSYVGGDTWAAHLGARPVEPAYVEPDYEGITAGRTPYPPEELGIPDVDQVRMENFEKALENWKAVAAQEEADRAAYGALIDKLRAEYTKAMKAWQEADAKYGQDYEAVRATVDRIAFSGRVPVNVLGAAPGQYIVPVQDGDGIKGIAKNEADMTLGEYMRSVGQVTMIEADGRARVIVK
jgi:hypothetical protein